MRYGKHYKREDPGSMLILLIPVTGLFFAVWGTLIYLLHYVYRSTGYYGLILFVAPISGIPIGLIGLRKRWTEWLSVIDIVIGIFTLLLVVVYLAVTILSGRF